MKRQLLFLFLYTVVERDRLNHRLRLPTIYLNNLLEKESDQRGKKTDRTTAILDDENASINEGLFPEWLLSLSDDTESCSNDYLSRLSSSSVASHGVCVSRLIFLVIPRKTRARLLFLSSGKTCAFMS